MGVLLLTLQVVLLGALTSISIEIAGQNESFWSVAPAAFAAVGTVAAFFVTFALFLISVRDRVREQASAVYMTRERGEGGAVKIAVHNDSKLPIWEVQARPLRTSKVFKDEIDQPENDIPPGETMEFEWPGGGTPIDRDWRIKFTDAADRDWVRVGKRLSRERRWSKL